MEEFGALVDLDEARAAKRRRTRNTAILCDVQRAMAARDIARNAVAEAVPDSSEGVRKETSPLQHRMTKW